MGSFLDCDPITGSPNMKKIEDAESLILQKIVALKTILTPEQMEEFVRSLKLENEAEAEALKPAEKEKMSRRICTSKDLKIMVKGEAWDTAQYPELTDRIYDALVAYLDHGLPIEIFENNDSKAYEHLIRLLDEHLVEKFDFALGVKHIHSEISDYDLKRGVLFVIKTDPRAYQEAGWRSMENLLNERAQLMAADPRAMKYCAVSTEAPKSPAPGDLWYDTSIGPSGQIMKVFNGERWVPQNPHVNGMLMSLSMATVTYIGPGSGPGGYGIGAGGSGGAGGPSAGGSGGSPVSGFNQGANGGVDYSSGALDDTIIKPKKKHWFGSFK